MMYADAFPSKHLSFPCGEGRVVNEFVLLFVYAFLTKGSLLVVQQNKKRLRYIVVVSFLNLLT